MGKFKHKQIEYMPQITHLECARAGIRTQVFLTLEPMALTIMQYGVLLSKGDARLDLFPITMS